MLNTKKRKSLSNPLKTGDFGKAVFFLLFLMLLASTYRCANIREPMGGPIDSIPPVLLDEQPPNLSTNFSAKKVVLTFDEFIRINNVSREISISPDMEAFPQFKVKRKQLEIEFPDSLAENTTYLINFGRAIADNNEGNPLLDYTYVFSTGDNIDSLSISGTVINAQTNEPEPLISVILIPTSQDSTFGKRKANIFSTTDSLGNFKLNYLRSDDYRIYALKEQNNDRIYNSPEEWIGFLPDSISLNSDTSNIILWTSKETPENFRILDRKIEPKGSISLRFNLPLEDPKIKITDPDSLDLTKIVHYNRQRDSATIWVADMGFDSIKMQVFSSDSLMDSLLIRRPSSDRYNRNIILTNNLESNKVNRIKHLALYSSAPLSMLDRSKIALLEDSVAVTNFQLLRDSIDNRNLLLRYNWKPKANYELVLDDGALLGYFEEKNERILFRFTMDENDRYGHLSLNIEVPDSIGQYIIELIDDNGTKIYDETIINSSQKLEYKNYLEGRYRVRIIYDSNKNGKWDPGSLKNKIQPERVWYYDKVFNIRPNWEQEETIRIPNENNPHQLLPYRKR
ncbi:MAG TPA: Ig-like domain-containing domain [Sphingobacteriaceae bacterium]|nr:Ig-like domain-containing domain [Sphingobacteriaceae bacterium]